MLDKLRHFISDVVSPSGSENRTFADGDYRLAATALLIHVISLDGEPSETEKRKLHALLDVFGHGAEESPRPATPCVNQQPGARISSPGSNLGI